MIYAPVKPDIQQQVKNVLTDIFNQYIYTTGLQLAYKEWEDTTHPKDVWEELIATVEEKLTSDVNREIYSVQHFSDDYDKRAELQKAHDEFFTSFFDSIFDGEYNLYNAVDFANYKQVKELFDKIKDMCITQYQNWISEQKNVFVDSEDDEDKLKTFTIFVSLRIEKAFEDIWDELWEWFSTAGTDELYQQFKEYINEQIHNDEFIDHIEIFYVPNYIPSDTLASAPDPSSLQNAIKITSEEKKKLLEHNGFSAFTLCQRQAQYQSYRLEYSYDDDGTYHIDDGDPDEFEDLWGREGERAKILIDTNKGNVTFHFEDWSTFGSSAPCYLCEALDTESFTYNYVYPIRLVIDWLLQKQEHILSEQQKKELQQIQNMIPYPAIILSPMAMREFLSGFNDIFYAEENFPHYQYDFFPSYVQCMSALYDILGAYKGYCYYNEWFVNKSTIQSNLDLSNQFVVWEKKHQILYCKKDEEHWVTVVSRFHIDNDIVYIESYYTLDGETKKFATEFTMPLSLLYKILSSIDTENAQQLLKQLQTIEK